MDFYERARKVRESKKRIIYSNREFGAEQDFLFMIAQRISQEIQDNLIKKIEDYRPAYSTGIFGRKIDFRYETSVRICFSYVDANVNMALFNGGVRRVIDSSEGIVLYQYSDGDHSLLDVYYISTCYLSDTRDILFHILKILRKDFADIFIEATWGEECGAYNHLQRYILVDGLLMTKSLIDRIMDKIALKDKGKVYGHIWFTITVEVPCDKKGNI